MITAPARSGLVIPLQVTLLDLGKKSLDTGIAVDSLPIRRGVRLLERKLFATAMKLPARAFFFANAKTHFRLGAGSKTLSRVEMRPRRAWLETGYLDHRAPARINTLVSYVPVATFQVVFSSRGCTFIFFSYPSKSMDSEKRKSKKHDARDMRSFVLQVSEFPLSTLDVIS